jgi:hypothetical protein
MFELNGVLNLYLVPISGDHIIYHYVYDSRTMFSWNLQKATVDEILMVGSGVTGGCVSNAGLVQCLFSFVAHFQRPELSRAVSRATSR